MGTCALAYLSFPTQRQTNDIFSILNWPSRPYNLVPSADKDVFPGKISTACRVVSSYFQSLFCWL